MDIDKLMSRPGMREYTTEQLATWVNDASQVRQLGQILQARLAAQQIEGDKPGSAKRRARKVGKRFNKVADLLQKAAAECEGLNEAYKRDVLDLPERRAKTLEKKQDRRQMRALAWAKARTVVDRSLTESAHAIAAPETAHGQPATPPQAVAPPPQYVSPQPYSLPNTGAANQPLPNITDLFPEAL
ncbi:hypothetical protein [Streptomyces sp. NPDC017529]|uniref:hypothetical protein n=1 Tax=Streptomyces sp. NPDC017529 TaxID=3365000 RepID=UPI0037B0B0C9